MLDQSHGPKRHALNLSDFGETALLGSESGFYNSRLMMRNQEGNRDLKSRGSKMRSNSLRESGNSPLNEYLRGYEEIQEIIVKPKVRT